MSRPSLGVVVGRSLMFGIAVAVVVALTGTIASGGFEFTRFATSFVVGLSYALAIGLSVSVTFNLIGRRLEAMRPLRRRVIAAGVMFVVTAMGGATPAI